jgi:hypothetical protein
MRFAPVALAAVAALSLGCSPSDQPSDIQTTTAAPAPPRTTTEATTPASTSAATPVISVTVAGGQVTPAPAPVEVKLGTTVVIEITSDVADEAHVHGYDRLVPLEPGTPARLELVADQPGQFDVELENGQQLLFVLRVA